MAIFLTPKLAINICNRIITGSFSILWRPVDIIPISKGSPPPKFCVDYRLISQIPIFKIFEKFICRRLYNFVNSMKVLLNTRFGFRKDIETTDVLLLLTHDL